VAALTCCYDELANAGVRTRDAAVLMGLSRATQDRRRRDRPVPQGEPAARSVPSNKLSDAESAELIAMLNSQRFVDKAPPQIYATLLAEGTYLCSISTMYRTLERNRQVKDRRRQATHPPRAVPELQATGPRQVYSWDITKLAGPVKGQYFDCYVMIDIYSRYIVGAHVHNTEAAALAVELMTEIFGVQGVPHVVHADRGTSMTSKPVAALLDDLGVTRSHSRPRVSNDNPFSEAWNKTLKYAPVFPERFSSLQAARQFMSEFVDFYNHHHRHGGIGLHTPADVHYGLAGDTARKRSETLEAARLRHPIRFATTHDPKILELPTAAWINQPQNQEPAA
jgi:putative transposase